MTSKRNFRKVFKIFSRKYTLVPLEIFGTDPYKTLVSTVLSSRTKDEVTLEASKRLFLKAPNFIKLNQLSYDEIIKLIYPVGFYKTKAKCLFVLSEILLTNFGGKVPNTRKDLMSLPGVGRKTANLVLNRAFKIPAIAVDTHVHRISNLLGWVKTKSPEQTEQELTRVLPRKYWPDTNRLFVSVGRTYGTGKKLKQFLKSEGLI